MVDSHGKKRAVKVFRINPRYIQVQGVVMLGSKQISNVCLSPLCKFDNLEELNLDLRFFKMDSLSNEVKEETKDGSEVNQPLRICDIPSFARISLNFIALDTNNTKGLSQSRTGYVIGSISFSAFEVTHLLK